MSLLLRPFWILRLFVLFLWDLLISSLQVARAALTPGDSVSPRFVTVPLDAARSNLEITLVANYITLTPGTITVEADAGEFLVHGITRDSAEGVIDSDMDRRCTALEGRAR